MSADCSATRRFNMHKFVLDVGKVVGDVDFVNLLRRSFKLCPSVYLQSKVLFYDIGVGVSDSNDGSFFHHVELFVSDIEIHTSKLISHNSHTLSD